jgi:hypothetical protein
MSEYISINSSIGKQCQYPGLFSLITLYDINGEIIGGMCHRIPENEIVYCTYNPKIPRSGNPITVPYWEYEE